jgi:hypothetical protein
MEGGTWDNPQQDDLARYWKISRSEETADKKLRRKACDPKGKVFHPSFSINWKKISEEND